MRKSILIFLFALLGVFSAQAYHFKVDGIYYNRISGTNDKVEVTSGYYPDKYSGSVVIPATVTFDGTTYAVTSIGYSAFGSCSGLTSVTIPNSVTTIGDWAFLDCSGLTSVTIPNSVTSIGDWAFYECSGLTSVTIPNSVDTIGESAFEGTSISSPLYNSKVFAYMPKDYSGDYTIPAGIQSIAGGAFYECSGLTSVTIPESVTYIGWGAFYECSGLTSVTIPESVTYIGDDAFLRCSSINSLLYTSNIFAYMPKSYNGTYTIPSGIQSIVGGAFYECSGLTSITIPNSVTYIGENAFSFCSGLTSITIPNSVTYIGGDAFNECSGLTSVEWNAVACVYTNRGRGRGTSPFYNCENLTDITFGDQVTLIPANLCERLSSLTSVSIGESVTTIGDCAFLDCSALTLVTLPENVTYIGYGVFLGTAISNPLYNSKVFAYMPKDYSGDYTIPAGIQSIAGRAFYECSGLTSVTIPNSVTSIGSSAFFGCSGLTSVTLPESVDTIENCAFFHCDNLVLVISMSENPPYCGLRSYNWVFSDHSATLLVPRDTKSAYQTAVEWEEFTRIYEFGIDGTGLVSAQANDTSMGRVTGSGEYEIDEEITIEAIPYHGYHFVKWDDENTDNPRLLTVAHDITLTAVFAQGYPSPNENSEADNFRVYAQDRTIHLSEDRGLVQVYNMAGQCVYNGHATAVPVSQSGVYIVAVGSQRFKVPVR